jgi:hypothetical protein
MARLTSAQLAALKADLTANTNTVVVGGTTFPINSNDVLLSNHTGAASPEAAARVAEWYNTTASPDYWLWRSSVSRSDVYNTTSPTGSTWDWTTYKNQGLGEQNAWVQMFMSDVCNFGQLNNRVGIGKIFSGTGAPATQRDHCLAVGRRIAKRIEKLFATAVTSPPANTGNNAADARGATTNPDVLGVDANGSPITSITATDIVEAWTS